ncbi:MAG: hypothetical protein RR738_01765 [Anaerorhabdus sp.]|uniref:hypothetical protein n=1 Tax=Anaerorhabdus sp. TaxID=1872524 RepID=UPI002FC84027
MKILYCATVDSHIISFHLDIIKELVVSGNIVDVASSGDYSNEDINCKFNIPFSKSPVS